jgi:hypothetical protein
VTASQTKLRKVLIRQKKLETILQDLAHQQPRSGRNDPDSVPSIITFQNDLRLQRWIDQRRASVNIELAQIRALISMAQDDLSRQIARQQALDDVAERLSRHVRRERQRRADYWS